MYCIPLTFLLVAYNYLKKVDHRWIDWQYTYMIVAQSAGPCSRSHTGWAWLWPMSDTLLLHVTGHYVGPSVCWLYQFHPACLVTRVITNHRKRALCPWRLQLSSPCLASANHGPFCCKDLQADWLLCIHIAHQPACNEFPEDGCITNIKGMQYIPCTNLCFLYHPLDTSTQHVSPPLGIYIKGPVMIDK